MWCTLRTANSARRPGPGALNLPYTRGPRSSYAMGGMPTQDMHTSFTTLCTAPSVSKLKQTVRSCGMPHTSSTSEPRKTAPKRVSTSHQCGWGIPASRPHEHIGVPSRGG